MKIKERNENGVLRSEFTSLGLSNVEKLQQKVNELEQANAQLTVLLGDFILDGGI